MALRTRVQQVVDGRKKHWDKLKFARKGTLATYEEFRELVERKTFLQGLRFTKHYVEKFVGRKRLAKLRQQIIATTGTAHSRHVLQSVQTVQKRFFLAAAYGDPLLRVVPPKHSEQPSFFDLTDDEVWKQVWITPKTLIGVAETVSRSQKSIRRKSSDSSTSVSVPCRKLGRRTVQSRSQRACRRGSI